MAKAQTKYDQIEDYLAGNLEGESLRQFELALQADPALAEDVALFREMATVLKPSKEDDLRANLELLGQKFTPSEPTTNKNRRWWMLVLLLIPVLGWWIWNSTTAPTEATPPQKSPVEENKPPVATENPPTSLPENPPKQQTPPQQRPEKPAQLAAAFQPNPQLEKMLDNQLRGDDYHFSITKPVTNATLKLKNGRANFLLSGTVETSAQQVGEPFRVLLFSNKPTDYENFNFLFSKKLVFKKAGDSFQFGVEEQLELKSGLYYYLIEAENSGTVFHVGKLNLK